jgi:translation initiation factor 4G
MFFAAELPSFDIQFLVARASEFSTILLIAAIVSSRGKNKTGKVCNTSVHTQVLRGSGEEHGADTPTADEAANGSLESVPLASFHAERPLADNYPTLLSQQRPTAQGEAIKVPPLQCTSAENSKSKCEEGDNGEVIVSEGPNLSPLRLNELSRSVQRLFNKVCPENLDTLVPQFANIAMKSSSALGFVVNLILRRAQHDSHYVETYADLVLRLDGLWQVATTEKDEAQVTFRQLLLDACHEACAALPSCFEPTAEERASHDPEELEFFMKQKKDKVLALMQFLGHLFMRHLLPLSRVSSVMKDLVDRNPDRLMPCDHCVECACALVACVGASLSVDPLGQVVLSHILNRLHQLRNATTEQDNDCYSKRLQFTMQDTLDLREAAWVKKTFSPKAVKRDELRLAPVEASLLIDASAPLKTRRSSPSPKVAPSGRFGENFQMAAGPPVSLSGAREQGEEQHAAAKLSSSDDEDAAQLLACQPPRPRAISEPYQRPLDQQGSLEQRFACSPPPAPWSPGASCEWKRRPMQRWSEIEDSDTCDEDVSPIAAVAAPAPRCAKKNVVKLPEGFLHTLIGNNGETVRLMQAATGARIFVNKDANNARVSGGAEAVATAIKSIKELIQSQAVRSPAGTFASQPCKWFMAGRCGKGDACTYLHSLPAGTGPDLGARRGARRVATF